MRKFDSGATLTVKCFFQCCRRNGDYYSYNSSRLCLDYRKWRKLACNHIG